MDKVRGLFERALTVGLKKRAVRSLLKKYYLFEEKYGEREAAERVLKRAEGIAMEYEMEGEEEDEVSD